MYSLTSRDLFWPRTGRLKWKLISNSDLTAPCAAGHFLGLPSRSRFGQFIRQHVVAAVLWVPFLIQDFHKVAANHTARLKTDLPAVHGLVPI